MDKIDTSTAEEATTRSDTDIIKTWKLVCLFDKEDVAQHLMTKFWSLYDPAVTSIWAMRYKDPAKQHKVQTVQQAKDIVTTLMTDKQMFWDCPHLGTRGGSTRNSRMVVLEWTRSGTLICYQRGSPGV